MPHPAQEALPQASPRGGAESRPRKSETADGWVERSTRRATPGPKPEGRGQWRSMTGSGGGERGVGGAGGEHWPMQCATTPPARLNPTHLLLHLKSIFLPLSTQNT